MATSRIRRSAVERLLAKRDKTLSHEIFCDIDGMCGFRWVIRNKGWAEVQRSHRTLRDVYEHLMLED